MNSTAFLEKRPKIDLINVAIIIVMWTGLTGVITEWLNEQYPDQKKEFYTAIYLISAFILFSYKHFVFF